MSGLAFSRQLTSDIVDAFIDGMDGDVGTYTAPGVGAPAQACRVLVNRAVQRAGDIGPLSVPHTEVQIVRADLSAPPKGGGIVTVGDELTGFESWKLDERQDDDDTLSTWTVTRAAT